VIVSINQPAYLPWLGYFDRIVRSDIHVVLDHVQFEKNSMTNRNKVRTSQDWTWLTVPVASKGKFGNLGICDIEIAENTRWQKKHWNTIRSSYSRSLFFEQHAAFFESIYSREWEKLNTLLNEISIYLLDAMAITTRIVSSSDLEAKASKSELILELCLELDATTYLSGPFGRDYLDVNQFQRQGIDVQFHDYQHPLYRQLYGDFVPYMSVIDLLFNEGPKCLEILTGATTK